MQTEPQRFFSTHQIVSANIEILRSLLTLLAGKRIISQPEITLMASFAKERLEDAKNYPAEVGKPASAFVDVLLSALLRGPDWTVSH